MGGLISVALIIILVSGLIAYIGDLVGRKMGRKRLSLMGLRPRHTAIVISVGVGMFIALLTLVSLLAINKSFREAFFTLGQVRTELRQANAELTTSLQQSAEMRDRLSTQTRELEASRQQVEAATIELQAKRGQLNTATGQLRVLKSALARTTSSLASANRQLKHARNSLDFASQLVPEADQKRFAWQYIASKLVFSPLSLTYGQEILSGLLPANLDETDQRAYLKAFFRMAGRVVRRYCPDLPPEMSALKYIAGEQASLTYIEEDVAIDRLLKRLKKLDDSHGVVIHVSAINNLPSDGYAFIAVDGIELAENRQAFQAGDAVTMVDMVITEQTRTAEILACLADDLLRRKLPAALRARKMINIARRFDPAKTLQVPEATMPAVSWSELMASVEKAKALRGRIAFIARSHTDVTYYGPVNIDIDIEPIQ